MRKTQMNPTNAGCASPTTWDDWNSINWKKVERGVKSLQSRIVKAVKQKHFHRTKALLHLMSRSFYGNRASVCTSCSSVPDFVVPLSSLHYSPKTSLRLTNRLYQLACKGLAPSGIIWYLRYQMPILGTHITYTQAGVSPLRRGRLCFVGQESGKFEVWFFVGSSVVKIPACV
ncbi:MAG: reverse transcriptase N-terminal domain-containing protein [Cyclobacteriaceae bacterium]